MFPPTLPTTPTTPTMEVFTNWQINRLFYNALSEFVEKPQYRSCLICNGL